MVPRLQTRRSRVVRIPWFIATAWLAAILIANPSHGQTFHGRLTTSLYAWERLPTDSTTANHLRAFQLGIFHLEGVADPRLSLHTYVRFHGDLTEDVAEPANYSLFNLYGQWKDTPRGYELRGGRQRVYAGVGNVAIDGGFGSYRFRKLGTLEGYVGVQVPLDGDGNIAGWDDRAYGARLAIDAVPDLKLALSFARRNRASFDYEEPGIFTGRLLELPDEQEQLYGSDLSWRFRPGATLYNRIEVDATQRRLKWASGTLSLAYPTAPWSADFEYMHRAPSIYGNSLFSVFDAGDYDEVSVRGGVWVAPRVRAFGQVAATFFDGDDSERFQAGVERGALSVSYQHRMGYGGDLDGISAAYRHPLREWVTLRADGGVSSYRFDDGQEERNVSGTVSAGAELRPRRDLAFDLEIQNLSQDLTTQPAFAGDTYDLRGLLRISYWFSTGRMAKGAF
jgi:hypothetical protein